MKRTALGLMVVALLGVSLLVTPRPAGTVGGVVYPCPVPGGVPPSLNGVLEDGEWNPTCRFDRELRGVPTNVTDSSPQGWHWEYPPFNQSVTLHLMDDGTNHYLAWNWTHHWLNDTTKTDSSPDKYVFALGFDLDHDRIWEDRDKNVHTIDDALVLIYFAYTINITGTWFNLFIPKGLRVDSWNATANDGQGQLQDITHPPGPLVPVTGDPVTFDYGAGRSPDTNVTDTTYAYAIELAVPNVLFHSTAGFGFGLAQETNFWNATGMRQENETYGWTWPTEWTGYFASSYGDWPGVDSNPYYPMYLGLLTDFVPPLEAVGGFAAEPTNDILLITGDIALNPHGSKPPGVNYQQGRDTTPLGFVSGMLTNPQPSIFDTNGAWINQTTGRPLGSLPSDVIFSIGGPGINAVSHYYENTDVAADMAPVKFGYDSSDFFWTFTNNGTEVPGSRITQSSTAVPPGTSDVFVIQTLRDADNRLVVLMYGTRYTGTWAAAWTFKFLFYPNYISDWKSSYYIVRWTDAASGTSADFNPDAGDTYTILAQG